MGKGKGRKGEEGNQSGRRVVALLFPSSPFLCLALGCLFITLLVFVKRSPHQPSEQSLSPAVAEVPRTKLELRSARLYQIGATNTFNGWMVEHYPDGSLRSRSAVTNGLLHGLSEGWHTNGQLQVTEHFKQGVSHGLRTKWSASGAKLSEASIVEGKFQGTFRKWHEGGPLAEQIEFNQGNPQGTSLSYYPSASLKARAILENGQVVSQQFWKDGEIKAPRLAEAKAP